MAEKASLAQFLMKQGKTAKKKPVGTTTPKKEDKSPERRGRLATSTPIDDAEEKKSLPVGADKKEVPIKTLREVPEKKRSRKMIDHDSLNIRTGVLTEQEMKLTRASKWDRYLEHLTEKGSYVAFDAEEVSIQSLNGAVQRFKEMGIECGVLTRGSERFLFVKNMGNEPEQPEEEEETDEEEE